MRISVDGQEVYTGVTPRSLGYVTLPLKPASGQRVRIELLSAAEANDAFNIKELDQKNNEAEADVRENTQLGIVEIECYEPAPDGQKSPVEMSQRDE